MDEGPPHVDAVAAAAVVVVGAGHATPAIGYIASTITYVLIVLRTTIGMHNLTENRLSTKYVVPLLLIVYNLHRHTLDIPVWSFSR